MATRVRVKTVMDGPGLNETIIAIQKKGGGEEEVILPKALVQNGFVEVGRVGGTSESVLIELPQESASGSWRVWVDPGALEALIPPSVGVRSPKGTHQVSTLFIGVEEPQSVCSVSIAENAGSIGRHEPIAV